MKAKIKELKHRVKFWRNSNASNYQKWKDANYELRSIKDLKP